MINIKQQNKLNYIGLHCEDLTKENITKYQAVDCAGAGLFT